MNGIDKLISVLPEDAEFYLCILPADDNELRLIYNGLSAQQVAEALYKCADEIIRQKIPLPKVLN